METIINAIDNFIKTLDWPFVIALLLLGIVVGKLNFWPKVHQVYKVLMLGILLGVLLYFMRGTYLEDKVMRRIHVEMLFYSYLFATSFYELLVGKLMEKLNLK